VKRTRDGVGEEDESSIAASALETMKYFKCRVENRNTDSN
jgi:hypothetical protein